MNDVGNCDAVQMALAVRLLGLRRISFSMELSIWSYAMTTERELIRELRDALSVSYDHEFNSRNFAEQIAKADAYLATPEGDGLAPIQQDEVMSRSYIPLPGGWEIQTKGSGSTFRLYDGLNDFRLPIADQPYLFDMLERMARDIHAAFTKQQESKT